MINAPFRAPIAIGVGVRNNRGLVLNHEDLRAVSPGYFSPMATPWVKIRFKVV